MAEVTLKEIYPVHESFRKKAYIKSRAEYEQMWKESLKYPDAFWAKIAEEYVTWFKKWDTVQGWNYAKDPKDFKIKWFEGGKLNVSYNCLDRHLEKRGNQIALIWEGNDQKDTKRYTQK